ncbi:S-glutathionyl-(chloro)hydroquinone reductase [Tulasnella sp. JGI-2019a]|nr:S-glutathionyl-(chloro)hydroquinone reductase [Tulasnella sp. JGI-2019a]KAG9010462.1 S-glutathionyl-(chloro)hydroquinone reductase [Tulasnella sp. JGI-2019a]KAG9039904.1 S-glutathionyl-(chloro)hydroquinone reductase [Tulasnella sp. JGI-2019a]
MSQDDKHDHQKNIFNLASADGHFRRLPSTFRNVIEPGGEYPPEKGRYHLFISHGCPWANRTAIVRQLKGLQDLIDITVVSPALTAKGWAFKKAAEKEVAGTEDDPLYGHSYLREYYFKVNPEYDGRFTVPLLWDKKSESIVNNESAEIIRIFNTAFNDLLPTEKSSLDLYPKELQKEIDEVNDWVYNTVNNGVYKTGFATTQEAYDANVKPLFASLDRLEGILKGKNHLVGDRLTEADVRLFTTMIRFDPAYHGLFKCNYGQIRHMYPEINRWMKNLYWNNPAFKVTVNFEHIKVGYYYMKKHNPTGVVPAGPKPDIEEL